MIIDNMENSGKYIGIHPMFVRAFSYIEEYLKNPEELGVYEIDGRDIYANVQYYQTREKALYEAHNKYIDVQYVVEGQEKIYCAARDQLEVAKEYDEENDVILFNDTNAWREYILKAGEFAIFYPEDAHMPGIRLDTPNGVKKVVIKVSV